MFSPYGSLGFRAQRVRAAEESCGKIKGGGPGEALLNNKELVYMPGPTRHFL